MDVKTKIEEDSNGVKVMTPDWDQGERLNAQSDYWLGENMKEFLYDS